MEVLQEAPFCLLQLKTLLQVCLGNAHGRRRVRVDETFFGEVQIPLVLVAVVLRCLQLLELVPRDGQRHRQSLSVNVQLGALRVLLEALLGVFAALELGKGRAATLFSVRVDDHLAVLKGAEAGAKELGEVRLGGVQVEVANEDADLCLIARSEGPMFSFRSTMVPKGSKALRMSSSVALKERLRMISRDCFTCCSFFFLFRSRAVGFSAK
ncbi:hypothetical protein TYRP_005647 [Tyrophagus putrescentiae]|nr:hypothetical protein TYRP_005647 [Tyrophagus putrescentiae]